VLRRWPLLLLVGLLLGALLGRVALGQWRYGEDRYEARATLELRTPEFVTLLAPQFQAPPALTTLDEIDALVQSDELHDRVTAELGDRSDLFAGVRPQVRSEALVVDVVAVASNGDTARDAANIAADLVVEDSQVALQQAVAEFSTALGERADELDEELAEYEPVLDGLVREIAQLQRVVNGSTDEIKRQALDDLAVAREQLETIRGDRTGLIDEQLEKRRFAGDLSLLEGTDIGYIGVAREASTFGAEPVDVGGGTLAGALVGLVLAAGVALRLQRSRGVYDTLRDLDPSLVMLGEIGGTGSATPEAELRLRYQLEPLRYGIFANDVSLGQSTAEVLGLDGAPTGSQAVSGQHHQAPRFVAGVAPADPAWEELAGSIDGAILAVGADATPVAVAGLLSHLRSSHVPVCGVLTVVGGQ
jgi:hypothetical protein